MHHNAAILLAFAASATAHMKMKFPVPFGDATLNNSPLEPGDWPCKQRPGVYDVDTMNQWNAGETQTVSFTGSAVHGGGSCQFSITTDPEPSESSQWKVIHSVVGGCPSNATGNLPISALGEGLGDGASTFPVTMPDDIPDGRYTFAWTWLNKIGNREFYMNCAPIQVGSGSSASKSSKSAASALSALPDMFVANLPASECSIADSMDFAYPNPGKSVAEGGNGASLDDQYTGSGCETQTKKGAGNGKISAPSKPESGYKPSSPKPEAPAAAPSNPSESKPDSIPANPIGGIFAPGASTPDAPKVPAAPEAPQAPASEASQAPAPQAPAPQAPAPQAPAPQASAIKPEASYDATTAATGAWGECTSCSEDGAVVCIGENQFGVCNWGCAVAQDLATGTVCKDGVISAKKRDLPHGHRRRHGSGSHVL